MGVATRRGIAGLMVIFVASITFLFTENAMAVPAFARQTGNPCWSCHFQQIPKLNGMGRAFKYSAYADTTTDQIEDDYLAFNGVTLPAAFIIKYKYVKTSKDKADEVDSGSDRGVLEVPKESGFVLAGKIADNVGFFINYPGTWDHGKVVFSFPVGEGNLGLSLFAGDKGGPFFGMEGFNTGLQGGTRQWENGMAGSMALQLGIMTPMTGITAFYGDGMFLGTIGLWGPAFSGETSVDTNFDLSVAARGAVVIPVSDDIEAMVGGFIVSGNTTCVECVEATEETDVNTDMFGIDTQIQGEISGLTFEFQAMYVDAGDSAAAAANFASNQVDLYSESNGYSASLAVGFTPQVGVKVAATSFTKTMVMSSGMTKDVDGETVSVGGWYNVAQNVVIQPEYTSYSNDMFDASRMNKSDTFLVLLLIGI